MEICYPLEIERIVGKGGKVRKFECFNSKCSKNLSKIFFFAPDCTRTVRFSISLILDAVAFAKTLSLPRFALNHRRPIIEGVLLARHLVSGAPREIGRTADGRALVPPFVRRRQASVISSWRLPVESFQRNGGGRRTFSSCILETFGSFFERISFFFFFFSTS